MARLRIPRGWWSYSLLLVFGACRTSGDAATAHAFAPWSPALFATAKADDKLVLLDLGTEWCHWCHVMERTTWRDPAVQAVLARHYVAAAADADRRLDLAARYQDYGWPATIVFAADGRELWKHRGYLPPAAMAEKLTQLAAGAPEAEATAAANNLADGGDGSTGGGAARGLDESTRTFLRERLASLRDGEHGGFGFVHKYLDLAGAEWLLLQARSGDAAARDDLLRWLDAERALHDPVWGGAYQYSHGGIWTNPHFEKVMVRQLADLRAYALAHGAFERPQDLAAARDVARYLLGMLRSEQGPFFASQDADVVRGEHAADYFALDDEARRARGLPRIERALWSRENGQALQALCSLQAVAPEPRIATALQEAADWLLAHRTRADALFAHGDDDVGGPFLADSLEMAQALLALGEVTADRRWWQRAHTTLLAIGAAFAAPAGYASARGDGVLPPVVDRAENVQLARLAAHLHHVTGDAACRAIAERAFAVAGTPAAARQPGLSAELLLADHALRHEPLHVVVVGASDDPLAQQLHAEALRRAPAWRTVEWIRPGETTLRGDEYPAAATASAFVCDAGSCSPPVADIAALGHLLGAVATRSR